MDKTADVATRIAALVKAAEPGMIAMRRDFHAHPELSFDENRTSAEIGKALAALGIDHRTGVGRTGVVGNIAGGRPGPTLIIHADMDALPIQERTGLPYASKIDGLMHACGHDVHAATLVGVAKVLKDLAPELAGNIRFIFQPAEETLEGAAAMIEDGILEGVDMAVGFHNEPHIPVGKFGAVPGATYAASDEFKITVRGKSGHAAEPHTAVDPIVAAAHLVTMLQTIVSREVDPVDACVLTIGMIHGGTAPNIIPDSCEIEGTLRSLSVPGRALGEAAMRRIIAGTNAVFRAECGLEWMPGVPPTVNSDAMLRAVRGAIEQQLGDVFIPSAPSMCVEDFAMIANQMPSFYLQVGSGRPGRNDRLHNSAYEPDEQCIALAAQALVRSAVDLLSAAGEGPVTRSAANGQ
ncbi:M20 metallopeptidase family protein [Sphingomonas sp. Root710]|uniref:M20 metallopeptidase family protein n=1 Tax=Sphingomonas sp. Root710 TaxID=1736594 RepID=UPI000AF8A3CC|nr:M20 family metallopeptidase [Sphingomonas sp. Root710]